MEFIREKIKEKPVNKKRVLANLGLSVLCGLVFAITVCIVLLFLFPHIKKPGSDTQILGNNTTQELQIDIDTENLLIPSDVNLTISDYQNLQKELYMVGNEVNKAIVTIKSNALIQRR